MMQKKKGLGRGLSDLGLQELLGNYNTDRVAESSELKKLPLEVIHPGRYQPRRQINAEALEELALSIRAQGLIQPIVVRRDGEEYEIIAGERRWRAARLAGCEEVPVIIRDVPDEAVMAMSLIENIQRQDLNIIEEATALQRLMDEFQMTHQQVADAVGKARASVTNTLRLLKLNSDVREWVEQGRLDMGHARALLALEGQEQSDVAKGVVSRGLSVRDTEKWIQQMQNSSNAPSVHQASDPDVNHLQNRLSEKLGAAVHIHYSAKGKGKLMIYYNTLEELEGILEHIH